MVCNIISKTHSSVILACHCVSLNFVPNSDETKWIHTDRLCLRRTTMEFPLHVPLSPAHTWSKIYKSTGILTVTSNLMTIIFFFKHDNFLQILTIFILSAIYKLKLYVIFESKSSFHQG